MNNNDAHFDAPSGMATVSMTVDSFTRWVVGMLQWILAALHMQDFWNERTWLEITLALMFIILLRKYYSLYMSAAG